MTSTALQNHCQWVSPYHTQAPTVKQYRSSTA